MSEMPGSLSRAELFPLGELAEVLPGISTGARMDHSSAGTHQIILSRHLVPGLPYHYESSDEFRIQPGRDPKKYEVRGGDVLLMSRGTRNLASWIESVPEQTVAPVSFYIIRPMQLLDASYLTWFMNQPTAQRAIGDIRTGA